MCDLKQVGKAGEVQQIWLPLLATELGGARKLPGSTALISGIGTALAALLGGCGLLPGADPPPPPLESDGPAAMAKVSRSISP